MIDIIKAKQAFREYLAEYDQADQKIKLKIIHTYGVVDATNYITTRLNLEKEVCDLAKVIALLHDIGRFEQLRRFKDFHEPEGFDHAEFGVKILFEEGLIRKFIEEDNYDKIIKKAIQNHNKYKVEDGLDAETKMYADIVRDADKIDNFRVKNTESFETLLGVTEEELENQEISEEVYNQFMEHKLIKINSIKNQIDEWIFYFAFIYDFNYWPSYLYIQENDYINRNFSRIDCKKEETKEKVRKIRECANQFIFQRLGELNKSKYSNIQ